LAWIYVVDFSKKVYCFLESEKWNRETKPVLLQRLEQLNVEKDLGITVPEHKASLSVSYAENEGSIEAGKVITSDLVSPAKVVHLAKPNSFII
jgi:hypothetical protein